MRDTNFLDECRARVWDDYIDFAPFARRYLRARRSVSDINVDRLRVLAGHLRSAGTTAVRDRGLMRFFQIREQAIAPSTLLIVAAEAALDICNHLAAKKGGRGPEDYADCMAI